MADQPTAVAMTRPRRGAIRFLLERLRDQRITNDFDMRLEAALDIELLIRRSDEAAGILRVLEASTRHVPHKLVTDALAALTGTSET